MTPQYIQWTITSLLYHTRKKNPLGPDKKYIMVNNLNFESLAIWQRAVVSSAVPDQTTGKGAGCSLIRHSLIVILKLNKGIAGAKQKLWKFGSVSLNMALICRII